MTFLAALRHDRVDAPWVVDGPINGEAFRTYIRTQLISTLKLGDIVVVDNLGSHKSPEVRAMIRAVGASVPILTKDSRGFAAVRICGNEEDTSMHLVVSCGSGDTEDLGFWAEHAAEGGMAQPDRVAVG